MTRLGQRRAETLPAVDARDDEFWDAVRALPTRQAQCVALLYLEDRPVAEIAEILDIAPGTVRVHLHEARATLAGGSARPTRTRREPRDARTGCRIGRERNGRPRRRA